MFNAALFTIARTRKQSRYPLTDERIKKSQCTTHTHTHTHTQEYYLDRKRNRSVIVRWMNLESVIQSDVRKTNIID